MNETLLSDLSRALEAVRPDRAGECLRLLEQALRPVAPTARSASGRPPRDAFARVAFVVELLNRVEADLPGGGRCRWVGNFVEREGRQAQVMLLQQVFPERDREKHNSVIAALRMAVVESFSDRIALFQSEMMPALERYFVAGDVPALSVVAEAPHLAEFAVGLANSLEKRSSLVETWSLHCTKSTWTVRADVSDTPRPPPAAAFYNAFTGRFVC